ncbi:MFS transporter [Sphaerisporangium melleum]|uniref:MFS transporter n=1 Tax=Sphaerisporangium melleum TaxID=321316 RepID=A0A917VHY8_9ACTN|nr:MFS transporter [Sphaerisporangium melleum]GGK84987.1 MFS transporter [Sphaerisporangium melleum]GII70481.1 MFS transporter [Sphaerisporangium melleum]
MARNREFRLLWFSFSMSVAADQIFPVTVTIAALNAGGSASTVGAIFTGRWIALIMFALLGGLWADRLPRRTVMVASLAFQCCAVAVGLQGGTSTWLLASLVFLAGAGEAFHRPAYQACLSSVLEPGQRPAAAALVAVSWRLGAIVGPGLGAYVVTAGSPRIGFLAVLAAYLVGLALLLPLREPAVPPSPRASAVREIADGLSEVSRRPWVTGGITVIALQQMLVIAPTMVLLPLISRDAFGGDAVYGSALAMLSVGGLAGGLISMRWKPARPGLAAVVGVALYGAVPLALAGHASPASLYACYALAGFGLEVYAVQWSVNLQREIPPERLARVTSVDWLASSFTTPLGLALTGPISAATGRSALLMISAVAGFAVPLATLLLHGMPHFRSDITPAGAGHIPAAKSAAARRAGRSAIYGEPGMRYGHSSQKKIFHFHRVRSIVTNGRTTVEHASTSAKRPSVSTRRGDS